jgi:enoyl-CoA hydratase
MTILPLKLNDKDAACYVCGAQNPLGLNVPFVPYGRESTFAQTEVRLGITQIMYPIYKMIGLGRARNLAFTGESISAEEAYRIGFINRMHASAELLDQAFNLAERFGKETEVRKII